MTTHQIDDDVSLALDDTDRAVLNARIADARADVHDIAAETGIVANRVDDRLARLRAAGVVDGCRARLDYDKLGYDVTALVHLSLTEDSVIDRLRADPQFMTVYEVTGSVDAIAFGTFRDRDALNETVTDLVTDPAVESVDTSVAMAVHREFEPFELDA